MGWHGVIVLVGWKWEGCFWRWPGRATMARGGRAEFLPWHGWNFVGVVFGLFCGARGWMCVWVKEAWPRE